MSDFVGRFDALSPEKQKYILMGFPKHLVEAGQHTRLHQLLTSSKAWLDAQFTFLDSGDVPFAEGLELAIGSLVDPLDASQLVMLSGFYAAKQVINQRTLIREDVDLKTLALLGHVNQALSYARLRINACADPMKLDTFGADFSEHREAVHAYAAIAPRIQPA